MKVFVWRVGKWMPSKFNEGMNLRVTMKGQDDSKTYALNVSDEPRVRDKWEPICQEGNWLEVQIMPDKKGKPSNNVNKYGPVTLLERKKKHQNAEAR